MGELSIIHLSLLIFLGGGGVLYKKVLICAGMSAV